MSAKVFGVVSILAPLVSRDTEGSTGACVNMGSLREKGKEEIGKCEPCCATVAAI